MDILIDLNFANHENGRNCCCKRLLRSSCNRQ